MNVGDWYEADTLTADLTSRRHKNAGSRNGMPGPYPSVPRNGTGERVAGLRIVPAPGGFAFVEDPSATESSSG